MAGSRKLPDAERVAAAARRLLAAQDLRGRRLLAGLSGGVDSVVLLHVLRALAPQFGYRLAALHVHHGLSRNAGRWSRFCAALCRRWRVPLSVRRVRVRRAGEGIEAAARAARYAVFRRSRAAAVALAHQLDDQAETVLLNLLRGAGAAGASGMPAAGRQRGLLLLRPLLEVPREAIVAYAEANGLAWMEDESNADETLTRNFLRRRVAPLLARRFPRWRESLARAARHFAAAEIDANRLLREFLGARGLRAPSERRLAEMLRQLTRAREDARIELKHDGAVLRRYRSRVTVERQQSPARFAPVTWDGAARLALAPLGGELRFRRARGAGIDPARLARAPVVVRLRSGGERLQPDARRPRRTLKNLFQEAGVPPWERERLPLLYCGTDLIWAPGLGVDAHYHAGPAARGIVPEWRPAGASGTRRARRATPRSPRRAAAGRAP
ncbi:MAG: tRNA lysidine(34) synthetase TilS [Betaproteobacteria bacterium]|nr:MAG: tRNA lysidine(34) synthetase TilS [Betaproteobacteria bacterium]